MREDDSHFINMKVICLVFFFLYLLVTDAAAQEACQLEIKNAPALFGLRLEMTPEQAQAIVGRALKVKTKKSGERIFFQNFIEKNAPDPLGGVRAVYLRFFDRQLYQIEIFYEDRREWPALEDFTNYLSTTLNLPASAWQRARAENEIRCVQFLIVADKVLNPRIEMTDAATLVRVEQARREKQ